MRVRDRGDAGVRDAVLFINGLLYLADKKRDACTRL